MKAFKYLSLLLIFLCLCRTAKAQSYFKELVIKSDSAEFSLNKNSIIYLNENHLYFAIDNENPVCEITVYPDTTYKIEEITLLSSPDFDITDSLTLIENKYYRGRIQFRDLSTKIFPHLLFAIDLGNQTSIKTEVKLFPYSEPHAYFRDEEIDLFQEEEKVIQIYGKNLNYIQIEENWTETNLYDYRIITEDGSYFLQIRPKSTGSKALSLNLKATKPYINSKKQLAYSLPRLNLKLNIKPSRIDFLNADRGFVYLDINARSGEEVQLDNNRNLQLRKTYRIEDQEERGGRLLAELYTVSQIANTGKILCRIKPYSLHRASDGYLFIKDGDKTKFITNFSIVEKPRIDKIQIMHEGKDWTSNLSVNPGEKIEVRIEGTGLKNSVFQFDGLKEIAPDSLRLSDETIFYILTIPTDISKKKISLFMNKKITPYELLVKEFQVAADFDFVYVNYDGTNIPLSSPKLDKPVFISSALRDINLTFDGNKIDKSNKFFGKQYLNIEIRIIDNRNQLVDYQNINNVVVCPGESSARFSYYDPQDCRIKTISLNEHLLNKTYNLEPFTQIQITVSHNENRQGQVGFSRKIKFILVRQINFDMQVSFPAGLFVKRFNQEGFGNLSGISTAVLAQLSFYDPERIGRLRPYKVGAGFIALNAFNFSDDPNVTRDIGVVVIGSLLPIRRDSKFSIPLYAGGGYLLKNSSWFIIFGPGIQFNF